MGLSYPGGVHLDKLARFGDRDAVTFPRVHFDDGTLDFSFSGVKTAIVNLIHQKKMKGEHWDAADVAAGYMHAITDVLCENFMIAAERDGWGKLVLAGGVSANSMLREKVLKAASEKGFSVFMPPLSLCGDNAAMIGSQAYYEVLAGHLGSFSQNAKPTMSIEKDFM